MNKFLNCESTSKCYQQRKGAREGTLSEYCGYRCTSLSRLENSRYLFTAAEVGRPGCVRWLGRYCYFGYWASTLLSPHPRHVTKVRHRQGGKYAAATRHQAAATAALTAEIYRQLQMTTQGGFAIHHDEIFIKYQILIDIALDISACCMLVWAHCVVPHSALPSPVPTSGGNQCRVLVTATTSVMITSSCSWSPARSCAPAIVEVSTNIRNIIHKKICLNCLAYDSFHTSTLQVGKVGVGFTRN